MYSGSTNGIVLSGGCIIASQNPASVVEVDNIIAFANHFFSNLVPNTLATKSSFAKKTACPPAHQ